MREPDDPTRTSVSEIYLHQNKYVKFRMTDPVKDLGQNLVPFVDLQEVTLDPPLPLDGIGIFYKGRNDFGGFIAPKIIHYDLSKNFKADSLKISN